MKPKYAKILEKAQTGKSPTAAIHIKCLRCMDENREAVRNCFDSTCSLRIYRPYKPQTVRPPHRIPRAHKETPIIGSSEIKAEAAPIRTPVERKPPKINPVRFERASPPRPPSPAILRKRRTKRAAFDLLNLVREFIELLKPGGRLAPRSEGAQLVKRAEDFITEIDK